MSDVPPIECVWDGEVFRPTGPHWVRRASKQYAAGEIIHIVNQEPRSEASHRRYFATVNEAWKNLPEDIAEKYPTADALRKYALIRTGWFTAQDMTCGSHAAALRTQAFVRTIAEEYAVVDVPKGSSVVTVYTAKTQSYKMGKADFNKSADDVLSYLANLVGVTKTALSDNAGKGA